MFRRLVPLTVIAISLACSPQVLKEMDRTPGYMVVDSLSPEPSSIVKMISPYQRELSGEMKRQIGVAEEEINNHPGRGESSLGNFVADLILNQSKKKYEGKIDLALINAHGGLRVPIAKGPILVEHIYELMPFDNSIFLYELNGQQTKQLFDHCAATMRSVIAGATFQIQENKAIEVVIGGKALNENESYVLAISDYLSGGGGGFGFVSDGKLIEDIEYLQRDMIIDYIVDQTSANKVIKAKIDGRMKSVNP